MRKPMGKYAWVVFVTDGGKWYPWAAESLGARWVWLRGGVRSYVERWFRTVKDRLRVFNCAFPRSPSGLERARTFIRLYAFYYNHIRPTTPSTASPRSSPRERPAPRDCKRYWR